MGSPLLSSFKDLAGVMSKLAWIGIFAALVMAGAARSAPVTDAFTDAYIAKTQAALDAGDALQAANLADAGLNDGALSAGQRARLFLYRGLAEELLGFRDPAMRDLTAALDSGALVAPERAQALLQRGYLSDGQGRLNEAAKDYTAVIALKNDSIATALNNRANIYRRQNRIADARRDYQAALSAGGGKPQYSWYGLGQIAEAQSNPVAARAFYARAVAADPGYVLASERLQALGGLPDNGLAGVQDQIAPHPPASAVASGSVANAKKAAGSEALLRKSIGAGSHESDTSPPPNVRNQRAQSPGVSGGHQTGGNTILRPALDQARGGAQTGGPGHSSAEVQLGAWRSEEEAKAGWNEARLRAGGSLDGIGPRIVPVDLPGKGHFFRLRVTVAAGQQLSTFCAGLSAKGIACFPAKD
jgi:tetratricopeptide (TPR) repeat protein